MPVGVILTVPELKELTGCKQRARMIRQLQQMGVTYHIAADGWPRVHEAAVAGHSVVSLSARRRSEPDFDALRQSE